MVITLNNYEMFALDYIEGNLSTEKKAAFEAFLAEHPAIAEELVAMTTLPVIAPNKSIEFPNKKELLKSSFGSRLIPVWSRQKSLAVAASFLLLIGVGLYFLAGREVGVTLEWNDEQMEGNYSLEMDTVQNKEPKVAKSSVGEATEPVVLPETQASAASTAEVRNTPINSTNKRAQQPRNGKNKNYPLVSPKITPLEVPKVVQNTDNVVSAPKSNPKAVPQPATQEVTPMTQVPQVPVVAQIPVQQSKPTGQQPQTVPVKPTPNPPSPPIAQAQPVEKPKTKFWNKVRDALLPEIVSENDKPVAKIQLPKVKFNFD